MQHKYKFLSDCLEEALLRDEFYFGQIVISVFDVWKIVFRVPVNYGQAIQIEPLSATLHAYVQLLRSLLVKNEIKL